MIRRLNRPAVLLAVAFLLAAPVSASDDGNGSLQLDTSLSGDLLVYHNVSGRWFNAMFDQAAEGGFGLLTGEWEAGWTVLPAQFDGDALTDAFLYNGSTGAYAWAVNTGNGYHLIEGIWAPGWSLYTADFNLDERHDIFRYDVATGEWSQCNSNDSGGFDCFSGSGAPGRSIVTADLDGDGRTDVLTYDAVTGQFDRYLTSSTGIGLESAGSGALEAGWSILTANFNGAQVADLLLYNVATGRWRLVVSTPDVGVFTAQGGNWSPGWEIFPADLDGDSQSDLFLYNPVTGRWFECLIEADGTGFRGFLEGQWSPGWDVQLTDFNGDGRADVFLYDVIDGTYFQGLNRGGGAFAYTRGRWSAGWSVASRVDNPVAGADIVEHPSNLALATPKILMFGDSITFGTHSQFTLPTDRNHASYPSLLTSLLAARYPQQTISGSNFGVPGEFADDGRLRLPGVLDTVQPDLLLLLEGINDTNAGLGPIAVTADLESMIDEAVSRGVKVLIAKLTPVGASADTDGTVTPKVLRINERIDDLVTLFGLAPAVDLYDAMEGDASLLGADGLHPTDAGYAVMANTFFEAIVSTFEILTRQSAPTLSATRD